VARTLAQRVEKLKTLRDSFEDRLAEMLAKPRPSYDVDGQAMDMTEYQAFLMEKIQELNNLIAKLDSPPGLTKTQVFAGQ
jgi:hypothetical protein